MKKAQLCLAGVIFLLSTVAAAAQQTTPRAAVESFYKYDRSHPQVFNRSTIEARRKWFSPELYRLFRHELKREAAYLKKNPTDKPYFGEGLPFQPLQENCEDGVNGRGRRLSIKQEFQRQTRAAVTATFAYPLPCNNPDPIVYTIGLTKVGTAWVIDDINYGEDTTLKERLKRKEY